MAKKYTDKDKKHKDNQDTDNIEDIANLNGLNPRLLTLSGRLFQAFAPAWANVLRPYSELV